MAASTPKSFDGEIEQLDRRIAEMGGIAEKMLAEAMDGLAGLDDDLARGVIAADPRLDSLQRDIEESAVLTIARRRPISLDLRWIIAAIRVSMNMAKRTLLHPSFVLLEEYRTGR